MSFLLSGLLGLAVKVVPSIFKVLKADRQDGDVQTAALKAVKDVLGIEKDELTPQELAALEERVEKDKEVQAELRGQLSLLESEARAEQQRAIEALTEIDKQFIELEKLERTQRHQQAMELFETEQKSVQAARDHALDAADSDKFWVTAIVPLLSIIIILGFILTLRHIVVRDDALQNEAIFYTAIGTLATAFATVIGFHFGSSSGSKKKDELILAEPAGRLSNMAEQSVAVTSTTKSIQVAVPAEPEPDPRPDPGGTFGLFRIKVPAIATNLMSDCGLTLDQACGVLGNIGHECAGFKTLQEIKPIVPGSRGGGGWCQWTGPRRRAFEAWCQENGFDKLSDDAANYGFLKHEFETSEKRALQHLKSAASLGDATRSFMEKFERPGIEHFESRLNWAREAKIAFRASRN